MRNLGAIRKCMEMTFIAQGWLREMTYVLIKRIYALSETAHRVLIRLEEKKEYCIDTAVAFIYFIGILLSVA